MQEVITVLFLSSTVTMKAKDLKLLRKQLAKVNKTDYNPLQGISKDVLSIEPKSLHDEGLIIRHARSKEISKDLFEQLFSLFERNMGELYKNTSWGLDTEEKIAELRHDHARYLLVETEANKMAGFMHFRFEYDDDDQPTGGVLYIYEIQIDEHFQRQGLGKTLMQISEQIVLHAKFSKIMLTVFRKNEAALEFYKRLNYDIDPISPSKHNEAADYEILSKVLQA